MSFSTADAIERGVVTTLSPRRLPRTCPPRAVGHGLEFMLDAAVLVSDAISRWSALAVAR